MKTAFTLPDETIWAIREQKKEGLIYWGFATNREKCRRILKGCKDMFPGVNARLVKMLVIGRG